MAGPGLRGSMPLCATRPRCPPWSCAPGTEPLQIPFLPEEPPRASSAASCAPSCGSPNTGQAAQNSGARPRWFPGSLGPREALGLGAEWGPWAHRCWLSQLEGALELPHLCPSLPGPCAVQSWGGNGEVTCPQGGHGQVDGERCMLDPLSPYGSCDQAALPSPQPSASALVGDRLDLAAGQHPVGLWQGACCAQPGAPLAWRLPLPCSAWR